MYNFIFYFFYKYFEKTRDSTPKYRAILTVAVTIGFHLFFIISIVKYVFDITIPRFDESYFFNKLYMMPFALLLILFIYLYYNQNRINKILGHYNNEEKVFTFKNVATIIFVIIVPLILGITLIKMGQRI